MILGQLKINYDENMPIYTLKGGMLFGIDL